MNNVLSVNNLSIHMEEDISIENISFDINEGEAVLLSGENGIGKSTLLKTIILSEIDDKQIQGSIISRSYGDLFKLNSSQRQEFRSKIAYIKQKDEYSEMGSIQVKDVFSDSYIAHTGKPLSFSEVDDLIDEWLPRRKDNKRVFNAKDKPGKFSGGEQRLLSVLSIIATRPDSELLIIDEPLNNLDYINARNISNIINRVLKENNHMALLMVSHCRIFPFISREIQLTRNGIYEATNSYVCHSCFGKHNAEGYYI